MRVKFDLHTIPGSQNGGFIASIACNVRYIYNIIVRRIQSLWEGRHGWLPERRDGYGQRATWLELHPDHHRVHIPA
jgi:hypothetical protein